MDNGNLVSKYREQGGGVTMLVSLRTKRPIVHCITNNVVAGAAGVAMILALAEAEDVAVQINKFKPSSERRKIV